jgi:RNA polymerase sigma factor (sigma-70 family)
MGFLANEQAEPALLLRAQAGDMEAHAGLYATYGRGVYTLARRMLTSTSLAEDVLQETFIEVIRKIQTYRGEAELGHWIRRIAVNKCLMLLRSSWESKREGEALNDEIGAPPERVDERLDLAQALTELSPTARAVVWLHDVEGYTHKEIGGLMGRTSSFSKSRLARAHERLKVLLEGEGAEQETEQCDQPLKTC